MLILSRRPGEAIVIDGRIRVVVLSSDARGIRLGIDAPTEVGVVREELAERIAEQNRRAELPPDAREWVEGLVDEQERDEG